MEFAKPKVLLMLSILFFVVASSTAYYKESGLRDVQKLNKAIFSVDQEISTLERDNRRIAIELESLNSDDTYVESIARENLGLVKPGEIVYEFIEIDKLTGPSN